VFAPFLGAYERGAWTVVPVTLAPGDQIVLYTDGVIDTVGAEEHFGIRRREEIAWNLEHISHMIKAASWLSSMDLPVRLICIPEGGLQGFTDEVLDLDHETYALECAIDIPGPETDYLGRLAQQWDAYVIAQAKARHPEFPGRFFNVGFVIEPEDGTVILKHHKLVPLLPVEHSVTPHS
jgi:Stage II sporulation protein E (SpoIIE)/Carbon-nitrogen hydrolase